MRTQKPLSRSEVMSIIGDIECPPYEFLLLDKGDGWLLQLQYPEADVEDPRGPLTTQKTRKWYISPYSTCTEIVETAYAACLRSAKHRVREHFTYLDGRVMSPHLAVGRRLAICNDDMLDRRVPIPPAPPSVSSRLNSAIEDQRSYGTGLMHASISSELFDSLLEELGHLLVDIEPTPEQSRVLTYRDVMKVTEALDIGPGDEDFQVSDRRVRSAMQIEGDST